MLVTLILEFLAATLVFVGVSSIRRSWRERARWTWLDAAAPPLAFGLWLPLAMNHEPAKSLANAAIEPLLLAIALGVLALARVAVGNRLPAPAVRVLFLSLSAAAAAAVGVLIGPMAE